jgi:hypothetical protein
MKLLGLTRVSLLGTLLVATIFAGGVIGIPRVGASPRAVILSPLDWIQPMPYVNDIVQFLTSNGFQVDVLRNEEVSVDFFRTELSNYRVIILRTDAYVWAHVVYWYLGELSTAENIAEHANDIGDRLLNFESFSAGFSDSFIREYYAPNRLPGSFVFVAASVSLVLSAVFREAGAQSFTGYWKPIDFAWGFYDYLTRLVMFFMAEQQMSVHEAVRAVVDIFMQRAYKVPEEAVLIPSLADIGNGAVTLYSLAG